MGARKPVKTFKKGNGLIKVILDKEHLIEQPSEGAGYMHKATFSLANLQSSSFSRLELRCICHVTGTVLGTGPVLGAVPKLPEPIHALPIFQKRWPRLRVVE